MSEDWIKMRKELPTDPAVIALADECELSEDAVVGKLHRLWSWADSHLESGNAPSVTRAFVNRYIGAQNFAEVMIKVGWLIEDEGGIAFPNFDRHMSKNAKRRAVTAKRAAKHREKKTSRKRNAPSVTVSLSYLLPISLKEIEKEWLEFVEMRRAKGKPFKTQVGVNRAIKLLENNHDRAAAILDYSIRNEYQGLFPEAVNGNGTDGGFI